MKKKVAIFSMGHAEKADGSVWAEPAGTKTGKGKD
jgi:hypothetical protein